MVAGRQAAGGLARSDGWQRPDPYQGPVELVLPWPVQRAAKCWRAGAVDQSAGHADELGPQSGHDGELVSGVDLAQHGGPAAQVVGEHSAGQPGGVGTEVAGGAVVRPSLF